MSSKSAVKLLVNDGGKESGQSLLFKWVAILTGSKNALKGLGFLCGGVLLSKLGFSLSLWTMAGALAIVLVCSIVFLRAEMGKSKEKVKFSQLFSKSREINMLSSARFFLFGSRDVWFVVGLPVFLTSQLGWEFTGVGGFLAAWGIGYGLVQAAQRWGFTLAGLSAAIAIALQFEFYPTVSVMVGLACFAVVFAVNSAVHSYLILAYTDSDKVALNVGFYYMANAGGRLTGTLLSGVMYLVSGLPGCLWVSTCFVLVAACLTLLLPGNNKSPQAI